MHPAFAGTRPAREAGWASAESARHARQLALGRIGRYEHQGSRRDAAKDRPRTRGDSHPTVYLHVGGPRGARTHNLRIKRCWDAVSGGLVRSLVVLNRVESTLFRRGLTALATAPHLHRGGSVAAPARCPRACPGCGLAPAEVGAESLFRLQHPLGCVIFLPRAAGARAALVGVVELPLGACGVESAGVAVGAAPGDGGCRFVVRAGGDDGGWCRNGPAGGPERGAGCGGGGDGEAGSVLGVGGCPCAAASGRGER